MFFRWRRGALSSSKRSQVRQNEGAVMNRYDATPNHHIFQQKPTDQPNKLIMRLNRKHGERSMRGMGRAFDKHLTEKGFPHRSHGQAHLFMNFVVTEGERGSSDDRNPHRETTSHVHTWASQRKSYSVYCDVMMNVFFQFHRRRAFSSFTE